MPYTAGLRDFPVTWRHLRAGFFDGQGGGFFPSIADLVRLGRAVPCPPLIVPGEVILRPLPYQCPELRDWLHENCANSYSMAGRFQWMQHAFSVERIFHGVVFSFQDFNMAVLFKLFWAGG